MVRRGQVWTLLRGARQYRVLVISNDEYNDVTELAVWALVVSRDVPHPNHLAIRLRVPGLALTSTAGGHDQRLHRLARFVSRLAYRIGVRTTEDNSDTLTRAGSLGTAPRSLRTFVVGHPYGENRLPKAAVGS
jgi:mRNA interferase MazF